VTQLPASSLLTWPIPPISTPTAWCYLRLPASTVASSQPSISFHLPFVFQTYVIPFQLNTSTSLHTVPCLNSQWIRSHVDDAAQFFCTGKGGYSIGGPTTVFFRCVFDLFQLFVELTIVFVDWNNSTIHSQRLAHRTTHLFTSSLPFQQLLKTHSNLITPVTLLYTAKSCPHIIALLCFCWRVLKFSR
jgi:hypothetical protein